MNISVYLMNCSFRTEASWVLIYFFHRQTMTEVQGIITQQFKILNQLETKLPKDLIRTWSIDHKPLLLEDPLGRNIELPYEICSHSWGVSPALVLISSLDYGILYEHD